MQGDGLDHNRNPSVLHLLQARERDSGMNKTTSSEQGFRRQFLESQAAHPQVHVLTWQTLYSSISSPWFSRANQFSCFEMVIASQVWDYDKTGSLADGALQQLRVTCQTMEGEREADVLVLGGSNGLFQ